MNEKDEHMETISDPGTPYALRSVPRTGVIYVMTEAAKRGYRAGDLRWANLGQGAPETGPLSGAPARMTEVRFGADDYEYAPIDGLSELKQSVADLYNSRYRVGRAEYTLENVSISPGGRSALTRLVSTLGRSNVGHFLPDYTAYEELLDSFGTFVPIPIIRSAKRQYQFTAEDLREEILGRGLSAVILSNPCNPTGTLISGAELKSWVEVARELGCLLILDEFYSHYIYLKDRNAPVSAAEYVVEVNRDPVVIIDGLTKNWRYPGFRVSWTLAPRSVIEGVASAGSFLEGGCSRPMQLAALPLVKREVADAEAGAICREFSKKREYTIHRLRELGLGVDPEPVGGFYCWANLSALPGGLNDGMNLFRASLEEGVIIVPGVFFDINPGHRRPERESRFSHFARISFGPPMNEVERGLDSLARVIERARS